MLRWVLRSRCESFALVSYHEVAADDEPIPVTATMAAALLRPLFNNFCDAMMLRRLAAGLAPGSRQQDDRKVLDRLVGAVVQRRLVMVRALAPSTGLPGAVALRVDPPLADDLDREPRPVDDSHWLEIRLVDEDRVGITGQRYLIISASGRRYRGYTDSLGTARISRVPAGTYEVSFPDLDAGVCERVTARGGR